MFFPLSPCLTDKFSHTAQQPTHHDAVTNNQVLIIWPGCMATCTQIWVARVVGMLIMKRSFLHSTPHLRMAQWRANYNDGLNSGCNYRKLHRLPTPWDKQTNALLSLCQFGIRLKTKAPNCEEKHNAIAYSGKSGSDPYLRMWALLYSAEHEKKNSTSILCPLNPNRIKADARRHCSLSLRLEPLWLKPERKGKVWQHVPHIWVWALMMDTFTHDNCCLQKLPTSAGSRGRTCTTHPLATFNNNLAHLLKL